MSRKPRWIERDLTDGFTELDLSSWKYFSDYINQEMLSFTDYVYRGHADSSWKLEPTLDRIIKSPSSKKRIKHLERFQFETRGRRGSNPPKLEHENDWWALGQHHGLNTPLLDWSESPFVALYFAASEAKKNKTKSMSVFSMWQNGIQFISDEIKADTSIKKINNQLPTVKLVRPLSNENNRLVSQRGLFSRGPNNMPLEQWVHQFARLFPKANNTIILLKIKIPTIGLADCLKYLNRMNINHSTLFPDLSGASEHCNKHLSINKY
jgi:FRG domain